MNIPIKTIRKAHDHFFRSLMADPRVLREFFKTHFPEDLRKAVNLNHLEIVPGTHINNVRNELISDIVVKTTIDGHEGYLCVIVEHQSQPCDLMPFRCLKYVCNFIDHYLKSAKTKTKKLPLVIPMVVYHGKVRWPYSTDIRDMVDAPRELVDNYFLKPFKLIDLSLIEDETIKERQWLGIMELTLKHIFQQDILPYLRDIIRLLSPLARENTVSANELIETVLLYILDRGQISDKELFISMIKQGLTPEIGDKIMTIAEQFKAEGIQQGIINEKHVTAERLLMAGCEVDFIAEITQLPLEEIQKLRQKSHH